MRNVTIIGVVIVTFLLLMGIGIASARLPAAGDHVKIYTAFGLLPVCYQGTITEIGNGFVDLMCSEVLGNLPEEHNGQSTWAVLNPPKDICIGIGAITRLEWI